MGIEIDQDSTAVKKYRLGNQDEEYELVTNYLGWSPDNCASWEEWATKDFLESVERKRGPQLILVYSPDKKEKVELIMHHPLIKDAFPLEFYGEERSHNWWRFYKAATKENPDVKFVIPLH